MKRFSSNITDEELFCLFREAAEHYNPKLNDSEKLGAWESIANSLLAEQGRHRSPASNKWKKRCLALLMVWLITGGLAVFRIIQLQESNKQYALDAARPKLVLYPPAGIVQLLATGPVLHKTKSVQKKNDVAPINRQREKIRAVVPLHVMAEREGFEPPEAFNSTDPDVKKKGSPR